MNIFFLIVALTSGGLTEHRIIDQTQLKSECEIWRDSLVASGVTAYCATREIPYPVKDI